MQGKARQGEGGMSLAAASYAKVVNCTPRQHSKCLCCQLCLSRLPVSVFGGCPCLAAPRSSPTQRSGAEGETHLPRARSTCSMQGRPHLWRAPGNPCNGVGRRPTLMRLT